MLSSGPPACIRRVILDKNPGCRSQDNHPDQRIYGSLPHQEHHRRHRHQRQRHHQYTDNQNAGSCWQDRYPWVATSAYRRLTFAKQITADSWVVLELSSFQLIDLKYSPHIAVCLMVVPEHLNWHADMEEYLTAKSNLFAHQTADDIAIYFAENEIHSRSPVLARGKKSPISPLRARASLTAPSLLMARYLKTDELKLLGEHNWQNACAAVLPSGKPASKIAACFAAC